MKATKIFMMAALALTFAACSNNDDIDLAQQPTEQPANDEITITATLDANDGASTRALSIDGSNIASTWATTDQFAILYNNGTDNTKSIATVDKIDGTTVTITFTVSSSLANNTACTIVYPASAANVANTGADVATALAAQDGTIGNCPEVRVGTATIVKDNHNLSSVTKLAAQNSIFLFTTKNSDGSAEIPVTKLTVMTGGHNYVITPSSATFYAALPAISTQPVIFTATGSDSKTYTAAKASVTIAEGKYYQSVVKMKEVPTGALIGQFSVSDTKKIFFSKGNLQATYDGSNWTWAFAANQWDYIGNAAGNTMVTATSPFISENATVDLFGWVGASSTWTGVNKYGITSSSATNNKNGYGNVASESLKSDWGALIGLGWRTLSMAEWTYLLSTRTVNGGKGADKSYTLNQSVNGKKGMVIYPDNYTGAVYSGDNWASFEAAGCVFLPAAGWRDGTTIKNINDRGFYWSSTPASTTEAQRMFFAGGLSLSGSNSRAFGFSVRLVREVE